jgi:hypothetical protein
LWEPLWGDSIGSFKKERGEEDLRAEKPLEGSPSRLTEGPQALKTQIFCPIWKEAANIRDPLAFAREFSGFFGKAMLKPQTLLTRIPGKSAALGQALALALALLVLSVGNSYAQGVQTQTYVVQKGDTINKIARDYYGKNGLGPSLWRANKALVAHPNKLTPGDTLYLFPEETLKLKTPVQVPPVPEEESYNLYKGKSLLRMAFPKYFSYVADPRGVGGTGVTRIHVKREDPAGYEVDELYEVHVVGEIIGSSDRGGSLADDGQSRSEKGRLLLSTGDNIVVRFTEDIAKLLDSETYEDMDPYFATFPIYSRNDYVIESEPERPDYRQNLGRLFHFKGRVSIVAKVEGLAPPSRSATAKANKKNGTNQDIDPVSYVGRITYSEDAINLNDKILLFINTVPGPERVLDPPYVEQADTYVPPGN